MQLLLSKIGIIQLGKMNSSVINTANIKIYIGSTLCYQDQKVNKSYI